MRAVVYDCEIIRAIPPRDGDRIPGIEYCNGWDDHVKMGVSCICAYDYHEERYRVFCEDSREEWKSLIETADLLVGFNNIKFDDALLYASGWSVCVSLPRYDLLREMWIASGLSRLWGGFKTHGGFGLEATCLENFGLAKTGNGAMAPVDWQQGKVSKVIDYCLEDVRLTKRLFDRVLRRQAIISPKTKEPILLDLPQGFDPID